MADDSKNGSLPSLGSEWGGLNPNLIATFFAVKKTVSSSKENILWERDLSQPEVRAPITDGNIEVTLNWQSPFENVGVDQKLSSVSAMLQAGGFSSLLSQIQASIPALSGALSPLAAQAKTLEGKSNLTKLNSTQVFQGMPPLKVTVTALFRAFRDAKREVEDPLDQLMQWALPKKIAPDGPIVGLAAGEVNLYASEVPQIIGMRYGGRIFSPLVIETIPYPLTGPMDENGRKTHAAIALNLGTLTALDKNDWIATSGKDTFTSYRY